jgi:hypothetical protein
VYVPGVGVTVKLLDSPWNVGVWPRILLLESTSTTLCGNGALLVKSIVTFPAWLASVLCVNLSCPDGSAVIATVCASVDAADPAAPGAVLVDELGVLVVAAGELALLLFELPQAAIVIAVSPMVNNVSMFFILDLLIVDGARQSAASCLTSWTICCDVKKAEYWVVTAPVGPIP